jgi:hypothetical protein
MKKILIFIMAVFVSYSASAQADLRSAGQVTQKQEIRNSSKKDKETENTPKIFDPATMSIGNIPTPAITQYPFEEGFERVTFPPIRWSAYTPVGGDWFSATNHVHSGNQAAQRDRYNGPHDAWLITPQLTIPETGHFFLTFWSDNTYPASYGKNSVLISTGSGNPADGDFVEIWSPLVLSNPSQWVEEKIYLSNDFAGKDIYIAFRYEGNNNHTWFIDDVKVYEGTLDDFDPHEVTLTLMPSPISEIRLGQETVSVHVKNNGSITQSNIPIVLEVNGSVVAHEQVPGPIGLMEERTFTFQAKADLSVVKDHILKVYTNLPEDANRNNDTITKKVTNYGEISVMGREPSVTTCSAVFMDDGIYNNYQFKLDDTQQITFIPDGFGKSTVVTFVDFTTGTSGIYGHGDTLYVYEGNGTTGKLYRRLTGRLGSLPPIISYAPDGALTFVFRKNGGAGTRSGWDANITCTVLDPKDIGVMTLITPHKGGLSKTAAEVKIRIKNYGRDPITDLKVAYKLNNGTPVIETVPIPALSPMLSGDETEYTFNSTVDISVVGTYTLDVYTILDGDSDNSNDAKSTSFEVRPNVQLYTYRLSKGDEFPPKDFVSFNSQEPETLIAEQKFADEINYVSAGAFYDNHIYLFTHNPEAMISYGNFVKLNADTWELVSKTPFIFENIPTNMSYDYSTNTMYCMGQKSLYSMLFFKVNLENGTISDILDFSDPNIIAMTFHRDGRLFAISNDGSLCIVDKTTGITQSVIGNLGMTFNMNSPDIMFDHNTGRMFMSHGTNSSFYEIDPATAQCHKIGEFGEGDVITRILYTLYHPDPSDKEKDAGIVSVLSPKRGGDANSKISVKLKNYGNMPITSMDITYKIDEGTPITEQFTGNLKYGELYNFTFQQTQDLSEIKDYNLEVYINLSGDENAENDKVIMKIITKPTIKLYGYRIAENIPGYGNHAYISFTSADPEIVTEEKIYMDEGRRIVAGEYYNYNLYAFTRTQLSSITNFATISDKWETVATTPVPKYPLEMTYDYSTNTMYAVISTDTNESDLFTVDMNTGELTSVAKINQWVIVLACSLDGQLYSVDLNGKFSKINKTTGEITFIAQTEYIPSNAFMQSMAFDHNSGRLFWAFVNAVHDGALIEINPETGTTSYLGLIGKSSEVLSLYIPYNITTATKDAGVVSILSPEKGGSNSATIKVRVRNFGNDPVSNMSIAYTINNGTPIIENFAGDLPQGETVDFTFATKADLSAYKEYVIEAYTILPDDENAGNDKQTKSFIYKEPITIYGYKVYEDTDSYNTYGFVSFSSNTPESITTVSAFRDAGNTVRAGEYYEDRIFLYTASSTNPANYIILDNAWNKLSSVSANIFPMDMTYDHTANIMYAVELSNDGEMSILYTVNSETGTVSRIAATRILVTLACSPKGQLYSIDAIGNLCKVDKSTGTITEVGHTGMIPAYLQSMAFDHNTGRLFWAYSSDAGNKLVEIDIETGRGTNLGTLGNNAELVSLYIPYTEPSRAKDAGITAITTPTKGGSSNALLSVRIKNYGTDAITSMDIAFDLNGTQMFKETFTGNIVPGETVTYTFERTIDLSNEGKYTLEAYTLLNNDEKPSNDRYISIFRYAKPVTLHGYRVYDIHDSPYAIVSFSSSNPSELFTEHIAPDQPAVRKGAYFDQHLYGYTSSDFVTLNTKGEQVAPSTPYVLLGEDMTYDYAIDKMYAVKLQASYRSILYEVNLETGAFSTIANISQGIWVLACRKDGQLFGADWEGRFYRIDKTNGTTTLIGSTGYRPGFYLQAMTFDHETDRLFWAMATSSNENRLIEIELETGEGIDLGLIGDNSEITALFVPYGPRPNISSLIPTDMQQHVALNAEVQVIFDTPVSIISLKNVTITNNDGITVKNVKATMNNNTLSISHDDFEYKTMYTVNIPAGAIESYAEAITWSFTTASDVRGITLDKTEIVLYVGETEQLTAIILPEAGSDNMAWSSNNENIVTVTSAGLVKGIAMGETTVTARLVNEGHSVSCSVKVIEDKEGLSVSPNPATSFVDIIAQLNERKTMKIRIFNSNGALVYNHNYGYHNYLDVRIDISQLSSGIYIIQCLADDKEVSKKRFVK